jgi:hypothetical protein
MSKNRKGLRHSDDWRRRISESHSLLSIGMKGKHHTEDTKNKIRCKLLKYKGEERNIYLEQYRRATPEARIWRLTVFQRDHYICRNCGAKGGHMIAHHVRDWARYPEDRYDVDNGITLCKSCADKEDKRQKRLMID